MALTKISTDGVKDQNVDLTKLPHGDANNDGKFLRANNGADPTFESIPAGITINSNADNRVITGDANANTLNGESNVIIDSSGRLLLGTTTEGHVDADNLTVADTGDSGITIRSGTSNSGSIYFSDGTSGNDEYKGAINYNQTDNYLRFYTNGSERVRILSGGGITFNGDTAAANALDDYEEGIWTPDFKKNGVSNPTSGASNHGNYTRIGNLLYLSAYYYKNNSSNSAGSNGYWTVTGLPFSVEDSLSGAYQFTVGGYLNIGGTDYVTNSSYNYNIRWQANSPSQLSMYGPVSGTAWSSSSMEIAFAGVLKIHD